LTQLMTHNGHSIEPSLGQDIEASDGR
jgi:hypothetical protein